MTHITRRDCLRLGLLGGLGLMLPRGLFANEAVNTTPTSQRGTLILIELAGGNDGLNTFIPLSDPLYKKARPNIALSSGWDVADGWALHPALSCKSVWDTQQMGHSSRTCTTSPIAVIFVPSTSGKLRHRRNRSG